MTHEERRQNRCHHLVGFKCLKSECADKPLFAFYCLSECGFHLSFCPDTAGQIRTDDWKWRTIALVSGPDRERAWKDPPKMSDKHMG